MSALLFINTTAKTVFAITANTCIKEITYTFLSAVKRTLYLPIKKNSAAPEIPKISTIKDAVSVST